MTASAWCAYLEVTEALEWPSNAAMVISLMPRSAATDAKECRNVWAEISPGRPAVWRMRFTVLERAVRVFPSAEVKTKSPSRGRFLMVSRAAWDNARADAPVLVSESSAVRVARSISRHCRLAASPSRQPQGKKFCCRHG
jgi:hypothetical protein